MVGEKQLDSSVFESGASRDCPLWVGFERMGGGDGVGKREGQVSATPVLRCALDVWAEVQEATRHVHMERGLGAWAHRSADKCRGAGRVGPPGEVGQPQGTGRSGLRGLWEEGIHQCVTRC